MEILGTWLAMVLLTISPVTTEKVPALFLLNPAAVTNSLNPGTGPSATFNVDDTLQIPGKTLHGGAYTIRVLDHLSDRMVVRVDRNGKAQSTFLALPKSNLSTVSQGPIRIGSGSKSAMRGFVFPDGTVAEFVFPKSEAVELAKANSLTIPAIDPASQGIADVNHLSNDDMQMVTLWMLSPQPVGPGGSGATIQAAKYQVPPQVATSQSASTPAVIARKPKPLMAALPHTASNMPLIELTGLLALGMACVFTRRRLTR